MDKMKYEFDVEMIRCGQARPYADSIYEYIVTSTQPKLTVEKFCTRVLRPHSQPKSEWKSFLEDAGSFFYGYHTFEKIEDNKIQIPSG